MKYTMTTLRSWIMTFVCFAISASIFGSTTFAAKPDPTKLLKKTKDSIEKLLDENIPKSDKKALEERADKIRQILKPFFNFRMLAKHTLGQHWKKRNEAERKEFTYWLRALLQQAYLRGVRAGVKKKGVVQPKINYAKQTIKDDKATVFTIIRYLKKRKRRRRRRRKRWKKIRINWMMKWQKKQWIISDILTNNSSLMDTYKEQFDKIITKKSYKILIKKIRKKVNQLRKKAGLGGLTGPDSRDSKKPAKGKVSAKKKSKNKKK